MVVKSGWTSTDTAPGTEHAINKSMLTKPESISSSHKTCYWHKDWHNCPPITRLKSQLSGWLLPLQSQDLLPPCLQLYLPIQLSAAHRLDHITLLLKIAKVCPFPGRFPLQTYFHLFTKQPSHQIIYGFLATPNTSALLQLSLTLEKRVPTDFCLSKSYQYSKVGTNAPSSIKLSEPYTEIIKLSLTCVSSHSVSIRASVPVFFYKAQWCLYRMM